MIQPSLRSISQKTTLSTAGRTKQISSMAAQSIGDPDARFVLQGRDENTGELRPSEKSILLGETDEVLVRPAE